MIVITGGAGFIGSVLLWKFNSLGEKDILVVDQHLKGSPKEKNLSKREYTRYMEAAEFVTELESGKFNGKIRAIFHMGACSSTTEKNIRYLQENNTLYSKQLATWAVREHVYFFYASSAATYGAGEHSYSDKDAITPSLKPLNPYGQSKLDFDVWVLQNGFEKKITGFRFFNVYGPNEYHKEDMRSMVQKGFEQIRDTGRLKLFKSYLSEYPNGGQRRDFIYVKDIVNTLIWFYEHPQYKGIYNLGSGQAETWNELAKALFKGSEKKIKIEYIEMPESVKNQYQYFTEADLTKLKKTGCPYQFARLREGVGDYLKNHLLQNDPYL